MSFRWCIVMSRVFDIVAGWVLAVVFFGVPTAFFSYWLIIGALKWSEEGVLESEVSFVVPPDGLPSSRSKESKVEWTIEVDTSLDWWLDDTQVFPLEVVSDSVSSEEGADRLEGSP